MKQFMLVVGIAIYLGDAAPAPDHGGHDDHKCLTSVTGTTYKTVYETVYEDKCDTYYDKVCHQEYETKHNGEYKEDCHTYYDKECKTHYETIYDKECKTGYEEGQGCFNTEFLNICKQNLK